ncbi:DUF4442 domain-containing protein [uncultured Neptuniibacter sp.]|uniref:DUF4442 domain-containing protein n=1 Tax=uncultured Neptuniibacter sp. TaxID=502143 RepID=UPI00261844E0|nr:DUF4442 domain-containing protein [uncultured Neptuniibacter sp.]
MKLSPRFLKFILNIYPPYLGAGIHISHISRDWSEIDVAMQVRWYNKNAVGTHFGGSIYSMTDPHLMLLLMQRLGKGYWIWDKAAEINFIKATDKRITAKITLDKAQVKEVIDKTASGKKYLPTFVIPVYDDQKNLIATVKKTLYIKKR